MGCYNWYYPTKVKVELTEEDIDFEVYQKLTTSRRNIDRFVGDSYGKFIVEYKLFGEDNHKSCIVSPDLSYAWIEDNNVYADFRVYNYPEFYLYSPQDIIKLQDWVKQGNLVVIDLTKDYKELTEDFNSQDWKTLQSYLDKLWQDYPDLIIKFG